MADRVDQFDNALSVVGHVALEGGVISFFAAYPMLAWQPLRLFITLLFEKFGSLVIAQLQKSGNATIIFVSEEANANAANEASNKLKAVKSYEEKNKAINDFKDAYRKLIGFRNSTGTSIG